MRRTLTVVAIVLTGLMSYGLYNMKYEVRRLEAELAGLQHRIAGERDGLQVLRAEWAYLNRPARLQKLAANHLDLAPLTAAQVGLLEDLPKRGSAKPISAKPSKGAHLASSGAEVGQ